MTINLQNSLDWLKDNADNFATHWVDSDSDEDHERAEQMQLDNDASADEIRAALRAATYMLKALRAAYEGGFYLEQCRAAIAHAEAAGIAEEVPA